MRESYYHILSGSSVICVLTFIVLLKMSITDALSCCFSKSIAFYFFKSNHIKKECSEHQKQYVNRIHTKHYENFNFLLSEGGDFNVSYKQFSQNFPRIVKYFEKLNKRKSYLKKEFLESFSLETWTNLNINEKYKHTLQNCRACLKNFKYRELLARLLVNLKNTKGKNDKNTSLLFPDIGHILQDRTNKIMASARKAVDREFKKDFNVTFKQAQTYIQGNKKRQIYKKKIQIARSIKTTIEQNWKSDAVDR